jgi:hypothetical protein
VKAQAIYFSHILRPPEAHLTLNGWNIPFVNYVKYLGVIFDKSITWGLHIEMIEAKAFRTFVRIYSLFRSERLSANIKLTLHKALIRSVINYACLSWELAADIFLKISVPVKQGSQPYWEFPWYTLIHNLHMAFNLPYVLNYITKLCRQQAEVIQNHENEHVCSIGQGGQT